MNISPDADTTEFFLGLIENFMDSTDIVTQNPHREAAELLNILKLAWMRGVADQRDKKFFDDKWRKR